eukprot:CAMPEP_0196739202 /NCGR_PEP_ID=MMETSP1091-20130531/20754_1 /TAXON_ID=302021 /ORGANISM="Rhodomonas sp., Strain CCMP768" /LENGTH=464 /DNA_ID=CAMNT_0042083593 /DNA_START=9 /DNA_END=1403 /DNA_ORIENTATION=+
MAGTHPAYEAGAAKGDISFQLQDSFPDRVGPSFSPQQEDAEPRGTEPPPGLFDEVEIGPKISVAKLDVKKAFETAPTWMQQCFFTPQCTAITIRSAERVTISVAPVKPSEPKSKRKLLRFGVHEGKVYCGLPAEVLAVVFVWFSFGVQFQAMVDGNNTGYTVATVVTGLNCLLFMLVVWNFRPDGCFGRAGARSTSKPVQICEFVLAIMACLVLLSAIVLSAKCVAPEGGSGESGESSRPSEKECELYQIDYAMCNLDKCDDARRSLLSPSGLQTPDTIGLAPLAGLDFRRSTANEFCDDDAKSWCVGGWISNMLAAILVTLAVARQTLQLISDLPGTVHAVGKAVRTSIIPPPPTIIKFPGEAVVFHGPDSHGFPVTVTLPAGSSAGLLRRFAELRESMHDGVQVQATASSFWFEGRGAVEAVVKAPGRALDSVGSLVNRRGWIEGSEKDGVGEDDAQQDGGV